MFNEEETSTFCIISVIRVHTSLLCNAVKDLIFHASRETPLARSTPGQGRIEESGMENFSPPIPLWNWEQRGNCRQCAEPVKRFSAVPDFSQHSHWSSAGFHRCEHKKSHWWFSSLVSSFIDHFRYFFAPVSPQLLQVNQRVRSARR